MLRGIDRFALLVSLGGTMPMLEVSCRSSISVIVAALACLCGAPANAQWSPSATANFGMGLGPIILSQGNLTLGRMALQERARRSNVPPPVPAPQDAASLTYTPDPQITDKIRVSMIDLASAKNPALRPELEKAMPGDSILRDFDKLMAAQGYSRLNFADDVAMLLAVCWEITSGRQASEAQIRGVHDQMRSIILGNPTLRAMPGRDRQEIAETIAYQVLFLFAAKTAAERSGNQPQLAELRANAMKAARHYGIDVEHMVLTEKGFRRS
jgi:hypothetical protein